MPQIEKKNKENKSSNLENIEEKLAGNQETKGYLESSDAVKVKPLVTQNMNGKIKNKKQSIQKIKYPKEKNNSSDKPITTKGNVAIHESEDIEIIKQSDKPIKKLSQGTLLNKKSEINKILGKNPVHRKQILECLLTNLPATEKENAIEYLSPDIEHITKGKIIKN